MKKSIFLLLILGITISNLQANDLKIAAGAGYKKPLLKIIKLYRQKYKISVDAIFGNMKQISVQAKQTDISLLIGDKSYLSKKSKLNFVNYHELGRGKLVLAYPKKSKIDDFNRLKDKDIKKITMPHPKKTIYGKAGKEFLKNSALYEKTKHKLHMVATIPQSAAYIIANEVDAGMINLTAALANKKKIGGYIIIPQKYYSKISIVAGVMPSCKKDAECQKFIDFLLSKESKDIFKKYGL